MEYHEYENWVAISGGIEFRPIFIKGLYGVDGWVLGIEVRGDPRDQNSFIYTTKLVDKGRKAKIITQLLRVGFYRVRVGREYFLMPPRNFDEGLNMPVGVVKELYKGFKFDAKRRVP